MAERKAPIGRTKRRPSRAEITASMTLEEALKVVAQCGMQVVARSPEEELALQESSQAALGVVIAPNQGAKPVKATRQAKAPQWVEVCLAFSHTLGAESYGPGVVRLPAAQADLAALLQQHDQAAVRHQQDTLLQRPSRSYMIVEVETGVGRRNTAIQVPDGFFNNPLGMDDPRFIHTHVNPGNADYFAGINNAVLTGQGRMF